MLGINIAVVAHMQATSIRSMDKDTVPLCEVDRAINVRPCERGWLEVECIIQSASWIGATQLEV